MIHTKCGAGEPCLPGCSTAQKGHTIDRKAIKSNNRKGREGWREGWREETLGQTMFSLRRSQVGGKFIASFSERPLGKPPKAIKLFQSIYRFHWTKLDEIGVDSVFENSCRGTMTIKLTASVQRICQAPAGSAEPGKDNGHIRRRKGQLYSMCASDIFEIHAWSPEFDLCQRAINRECPIATVHLPNAGLKTMCNKKSNQLRRSRSSTQLTPVAHIFE